MISHVEKLLIKIEKAQDTLLDACDLLDEALADCTQIGGEIAKQVPAHVQSVIDKITNIVEGSDASSLNKLDELIVNMPIRAVKSQSPSERRNARQQVNLNPNTTSGPTSAILAESDEFDWRSYRKEEKPAMKGGLNWDRLQEQEEFGRGDGDIAESIIGRNNEPIDSFKYRQRVRETIDNGANEDLEHIQEAASSASRLEQFDLSKMMGISGSENGLPSFDSLRSGEEINIVG